MEKSFTFDVAVARTQSLIIIGASSRAACQSARRAGFECWSIDQFGDEDLHDSAEMVSISRDWPFDLPQLARVAVAKLPDAAIMLAGGPENHLATVLELGDIAPLVGCSAVEIARLRDPAWIQNNLAESSLPSLAVQLQGTPDPSRMWIQKRFKSGGGIGVRRLKPAATQLQKSITCGLNPGEFFQEFVDVANSPGSIELSGLYLVADRHVRLLGLCQQWIAETAAGADGFQYSGSVGPWADGIQISDWARRSICNSDQMLSQALAIGHSLLAGNARGLVGVDFVWQPERSSLFCLEVNPRYTASVELYERAYGWPTIAWHVAAHRGVLDDAWLDDIMHDPKLRAARQLAKCSAKLVVYATRNSLSPAWPEITSQSNWPPSVEIADRPACGTQLTRGQPVCTLLTSADTSSDCRATLIRAAQILGF